MESLLARADRVATAARRTGALVSIPTDICPMTDHGTEFSVRVVGQLTRKAAAGDGAAARNPFLPYESALYVADLPPRHVCLLNKFNVVERHLLVITRDFASQLETLDAGDFAALAVCLAAGDGLGFYNGGPAAGASQRHKHLQWIPVPPRDLPLAAQLENRFSTWCAASPAPLGKLPTMGMGTTGMGTTGMGTTGMGTTGMGTTGMGTTGMGTTGTGTTGTRGVTERIHHEPTWPFRHAYSLFAGPEFEGLLQRTATADGDATDDLSAAAAARLGVALERCYRRLLDDCGLSESSGELPPYNLLLTRRWMLLVPRQCEHAAGISFNALAFAGALLVKDHDQWEQLRKFGPWRALRAVAFEKSKTSTTDDADGHG
jgi:ATP adenylyltransferase